MVREDERSHPMHDMHPVWRKKYPPASPRSHTTHAQATAAHVPPDQKRRRILFQKGKKAHRNQRWRPRTTIDPFRWDIFSQGRATRRPHRNYHLPAPLLSGYVSYNPPEPRGVSRFPSSTRMRLSSSYPLPEGRYPLGRIPQHTAPLAADKKNAIRLKGKPYRTRMLCRDSHHTAASRQPSEDSPWRGPEVPHPIPYADYIFPETPMSRNNKTIACVLPLFTKNASGWFPLAHGRSQTEAYLRFFPPNLCSLADSPDWDE